MPHGSVRAPPLDPAVAGEGVSVALAESACGVGSDAGAGAPCTAPEDDRQALTTRSGQRARHHQLPQVFHMAIAYHPPRGDATSIPVARVPGCTITERRTAPHRKGDDIAEQLLCLGQPTSSVCERFIASRVEQLERCSVRVTTRNKYPAPPREAARGPGAKPRVAAAEPRSRADDRSRPFPPLASPPTRSPTGTPDR